MSADPLEVQVTCPGCGCTESITEGSHFRIHDHACPLMPGDMATIPQEIRTTTQEENN